MGLERQGKGKHYKKLWRDNELGIAVSAEHHTDDALSLIEFTGQSFESIGYHAVIELLNDCLEMNGRCTRIDVFVDFEGDDVTVIEDGWSAACELGRTRLKVRPAMETQYGINTSYGWYLGGVNSLRKWRLYDKGLKEYKVANKWQRVELELKQDYAEQFAKQLVESDDQINKMLSAVFHESAWVKPPYFWNKPNGSTVVLKAEKEKTTLSKKAEWYRKFVFPFLRMLAHEQSHNDIVVVFEQLVAMFGTDDIVSPRRHHVKVISEFNDELGRLKR